MKKHSLKARPENKIITILTPEDDLLEYEKIKNYLISKGVDASLSLEGLIHFESQHLSFGSIIFLKKRDKNADYVIRLKNKILESVIKKIENSYAVLIVNINKTDNFLYSQIIISYILKKRVYIYNPLLSDDPFYPEIKMVNPRCIQGFDGLDIIIGDLPNEM